MHGSSFRGDGGRAVRELADVIRQVRRRRDSCRRSADHHARIAPATSTTRNTIAEVPMAIDFTLSPELEDLRLRVRDFIQQVVKPGEEKIGDPDKIERGDYIRILVQMRAEAKAAGLWLPHMPAEWGGMGLGHVAARDGAGRGGEGLLRAVGAELPGARRRQHAHPAALGDRRAEGEVPAPAVRRRGDELLRHDRARGGRLRSDADPDARRARRRRLGDERAQVVHLQRPPRRASPS